MKKAITHIRLDHANIGKLRKLDELADEYQRIVQAYINWMIMHKQWQFDKYANIPEQDISTLLSDRWQRCAWQQACGIVRSWHSNRRDNPPILKAICIQANANVIVIEPSDTSIFDFWLKISTLETGKPIRIPISLYQRARDAMIEFPKLCTGVMLNKRDGQWYATLVIERRSSKPKSSVIIGVDIGMVSIVSTSEGKHYGRVSSQLRQRVERSAEKCRHKQKLNACLKRKNKPIVRLIDGRAEAFARNEIGRALNQMINELPDGAAVALERLSVRDMYFRSHKMNRALHASQLGYVRDKLKFKLDEHDIRYRSVQPAYSSQQCSRCGFTFPMNRHTQDKFICLWCGYEANADVNAASNVAERFGDKELNLLSFREVEALLVSRFMRRLSDTRSVSAELDTKQDVGFVPRSISSV